MKADTFWTGDVFGPWFHVLELVIVSLAAAWIGFGVYLNVIAELIEARVSSGERIRLPQPGSVLDCTG